MIGPKGRSGRSGRKERKPRPHIPQTADELTAEWFSEVLADNGTVTGVRCETISTDVGFMGEVLRCHLTWTDGDTADGETAGPSSVVVKVPTKNNENFALGDALGLYEREIVVYDTLRSSLRVPMPGYLYSAMDPDPAPWVETVVLWLFERLPLKGINWVLAQFLKVAGKSKRRYVLVLEDIADARPPAQVQGGSMDDALAALVVLARFHAANWMRTDAIESYKRIWPLDRASRVYQANYLRNREDFVQRFGDRIGGDRIARLDAIQERVPEVSAGLSAEPWTLLHNDYRLDNLLFRPDGRIVVLDHQGLGYGRAGFDVAYFITTALTAEHRENEQLLLRTYHDALLAEGVSSYSWEELLTDCRSTTELLAHRIVGAADVLDTERSGDGDALIDILQLRVLDWLD